MIDCGATKSMGSWEALDGLARMNEQRHGSTRFSLDRTKKTWYTFANGKRQQSEGEVAFKVNAGGRTGDCKINCLNTTGVPILLSVQSLSQMGAIIDFSTGAAFFRHLTDQSFVQLERASNGHLYLSLVEDLLSQPILDREQLQGFQAAAQVLKNLDQSEVENVCLAASPLHHTIHDSDIRQHTRPITTDTSQTVLTLPVSQPRQLLGSMQHSTTVFAPFTVNTNEIDSDVSDRSRCSQEGRMPSIDGAFGRSATTSWNPGGGTEVHDQGSPFLERRRTGKTITGIREDEQESTGGKGTTTTDSGIRESYERTIDQDHKGRPDTAINTEGLGLPGFRQAWSQDVPGSSTSGLQLLHLDRTSGGSSIPLETQEILVVAEDAKCISGTESGKQYGTRTDDKTHQTARGGKTIRRNASIERTRQKTQDSRTERSHLNYDIGGGEHRAEGTSQGVERTNTITDDVFARAWGGEFGRELCGMAETCGEKTMSALSTEEASWIENQVRHTTAGSAWEFLTEQTRVTLAEVGAHTGARMCNTVQELSERENAIKLGGTGNHLSDTTLRRQLAKTLEQKRPRHLWFSLRCGSYCTPVPTVHNKTYYLTKTDRT